jgi:hypothetical protein
MADGKTEAEEVVLLGPVVYRDGIIYGSSSVDGKRLCEAKDGDVIVLSEADEPIIVERDK